MASHESSGTRVAVVTGAGGGLGAEFAKYLAETGMTVVVADLNQEAATRVAASLEQAGARAVPLKVDVSEPADVEELATAAHAIGPVHTVVSNAGITGPADRSWDIPAASWSAVFGVNFFGTVNIARAFIPEWQATGATARLVVVASIASLAPMQGMAAYVASKHALLGLCHALRYELAETKIQLTVACPGPLRTGMSGSARSTSQPPERTVAALAPHGFPVPSVLYPAEAVATIMDGVAAGRYLVLTHPESEQRIKAHTAQVFGASPRA